MFDIESLVKLYGASAAYFVLFSIIFAETGLFIGFFLPGDSILFPAGILASQGYLNIYVLCGLTFIAAVLGNCVGYFFGGSVGKRLFTREDSVFFHKKHIARAHTFYEKHGGKAIILARFVPIIRTFAPIVAGVSDMTFMKFFTYSVIGALIWAVGVPVAGFYLGRAIPDIDKYLIPIIGLIIFVSILPAVYELTKTKEQRQALIGYIKSFIMKDK